MHKTQALIFTAVILAVLLVCSGLTVLLISSGLLKAPEPSESLTASQTHQLEDFNQVHIDLVADVTIVQAEEPYAEVTSTEEDKDRIKAKVENNVLTIHRESFFFFNINTPPQITIGVTDLEDITINGSADLTASGLNLDELDVTINGSGDVQISDLVTRQGVEVTINGSGEVVMSGEAPDQQILINASGSFDGTDLEGANGEVEISGSGEVRINVSDSLDVTITGSGEVLYVQEPTDIQQQIFGSGEIRKL